ncbi:MAG TPA: hypothetical protein VN368_01860, partial [Candidatus Methylomirabilis sp.]|nr:hypothetical protein [Candidatus Methylomirabilis sp.]
GFSAHRMCPEDWGIGRYFAGFLYMLNPFIYVRFLAGHWFLLLAYAVTPFVIKGLMDFFEHPSTRRTIISVFLFTLVFIIDPHTPFLILIVLGIIFLAELIEYRKINNKIYNLSRSIILFGIFLLFLNLYWLIPSFAGSSASLGEISEYDLHTFTTKRDLNFNTLFTAASMYGFWRTGYIYTKDILPYWYLFFIFILFLAVHGFISHRKHTEYGIYVRAFGAVAVLSSLLAAGISGPMGDLFEFLFNNVFFFKGFREPQKFVALLVLAYAYLGGLGVSEFEKIVRNPAYCAGIRKIGAWLIIALALATPFIYSFTMFNGFWGQLKPADYPGDWYEVNDFLNQDDRDFKVLFFPWHAYMNFNWLPGTQKRLANPAYLFFDRPVIQGDNMEAGGIYSSSTNPISKYIEFLLANRNKIDNLGELIAPLNVKYIILLKEADYRSYEFLNNQTDIEPVKNTENMLIFKNRYPVQKYYQVDSISTIRSWDDLLDISRTNDIMDSAYMLGNTTEIHLSGMQVLDYKEISPVEYELEKPSMRYVVFAEKFSGDWKLGGSASVANLGVTNVYNAERLKGQMMYYERFNVYLAGYIISGVSLAILLVVYYRENRKDKRVLSKTSGDANGIKNE